MLAYYKRVLFSFPGDTCVSMMTDAEDIIKKNSLNCELFSHGTQALVKVLCLFHPALTPSMYELFRVYTTSPPIFFSMQFAPKIRREKLNVDSVKRHNVVIKTLVCYSYSICIH